MSDLMSTYSSKKAIRKRLILLERRINIYFEKDTIQLWTNSIYKRERFPMEYIKIPDSLSKCINDFNCCVDFFHFLFNGKRILAYINFLYFYNCYYFGIL